MIHWLQQSHTFGFCCHNVSYWCN